MPVHTLRGKTHRAATKPQWYSTDSPPCVAMYSNRTRVIRRDSTTEKLPGTQISISFCLHRRICFGPVLLASPLFFTPRVHQEAAAATAAPPFSATGEIRKGEKKKNKLWCPLRLQTAKQSPRDLQKACQGYIEYGGTGADCNKPVASLDGTRGFAGMSKIGSEANKKRHLVSLPSLSICLLSSGST